MAKAPRKRVASMVCSQRLASNDAQPGHQGGGWQAAQYQAAVDAKHQVIVVAEVIRSGSKQQALMPLIEASGAIRDATTLITADAGYHSNENLKQLRAREIPALIADGEMRKRDERFAEESKHKAKPDPLYDKNAPGDRGPKKFQPSDFQVDETTNSCLCPAGERLYSNGSNCTVNGRRHHKYTGAASSCVPCGLRKQCLRTPDRTRVR
ncbi:MAG: transposase [Betaproteobacteria bacterium]|nr:transposase [Betaproteobacteria bacterium]